MTSLNQYKSITPSVANRLWQVSTILAGVARVRFIVDSSKSPKRTALAVKAMPENSRILWLTRDGRGVVHSLKKDEVLPVEDLAQRWLRTNQICGQIVDSLGREQAMHLRYEEFCVAPEDAISRILTFLHPDLKDAQTRSTRMAHNIAGNRCRYTFRKTVRQDLSWRERLSQDDVAQFERIGGALNRQLLGKLFVD